MDQVKPVTETGPSSTMPRPCADRVKQKPQTALKFWMHSGKGRTEAGIEARGLAAILAGTFILLALLLLTYFAVIA